MADGEAWRRHDGGWVESRRKQGFIERSFEWNGENSMIVRVVFLAFLAWFYSKEWLPV